MAERDDDFLYQHEPYLGEPDHEAPEVDVVKIGSVVKFRYADKLRTVYVTNPNYENKLHGIDMKLVPRLDLLKVANAPSALTPSQLYEQFIKKHIYQTWDAYRTYDLPRIKSVGIHVYNTALQPGEESTPEVEEPEVVDEDILPTE
jgi:hypothetical protein